MSALIFCAKRGLLGGPVVQLGEKVVSSWDWRSGVGSRLIARDLLELSTGEPAPLDLRARFANEVVRHLPVGGWTLTAARIRAWLRGEDCLSFSAPSCSA